MAKVIRNIDTELHAYAGQEIPAGESYTIQSTEQIKFASSDALLADIASGKAQVNNGVADISGINNQITYLKDGDITPRDSDGSPLQRVKITTSGWAYQMHGAEFKTSQLDSIYAKKDDGTNFGFMTLRCYNADNVQLTTQEDCDSASVKTVIDWEPTHDYEIMGGMFRQLEIPTSDMRLWVVGVPDVPAQYGGSKLFISNMNLRFTGLEEGIKVDGRAPKYMTYNATYHSNKLRMILKHDAGVKHQLQIVFELFKA